MSVDGRGAGVYLWPMPTRKRTSIHNPKRLTLAEQWDAYDAAVAETYRRNIIQMQWVDQGEKWAREFVSRPYAAKMMSAPSFDPEEEATEWWIEAATEEEVKDSLGFMGVQVGFADELERLTGRKFLRSSTSREQWNIPFHEVQKMFKRPRGARPNY